MMRPPTPPAPAPPPDPPIEWCAYCSVFPIVVDEDDEVVIVPGGFLCSFCADLLTQRQCIYCEQIHGVSDSMTLGMVWGHA